VADVASAAPSVVPGQSGCGR